MTERPVWTAAIDEDLLNELASVRKRHLRDRGELMREYAIAFIIHYDLRKPRDAPPLRVFQSGFSEVFEADP